MKTAYGHTLRRAMGAGLALMAASVVVACGGDSEGPDNVTPQFTSQATGAETMQEEIDASSSSATSSASSTSTETAASGPAVSSSAAALRNDDGSYRLTNRAPGPGVPEDVELSFGEMPDAGMKNLTIKIQAKASNGFLQYPVDDDAIYHFTWAAENLAGESDGACDVSVALLDREDVDRKKLSSIFSDERVHQSCSSGVVLVPDTVGEMSLELAISQPGYDPVTIRQPLLVV